MTKVISRKEAKEKGLQFYFTGKPCKHGHVARRFTLQKTCEICRKIWRDAWNAKNPEKMRVARNKSVSKWQANNKEKCAARAKAWRDRNLEHARETQRLWEADNKERRRLQRGTDKAKKRINAYMAQWRAQNPDRVVAALAKYRAANPERHKQLARVNVANRRVRISGNGGSHTTEEIKDIFRLQRGRCAYCKAKLKASFHVDHIIPVSSGGNGNRGNLQILCQTCNLRKGARDPVVYAQVLGMLV